MTRRWLAVAGVAIGVAGCPTQIGDACGPDLPPCPSGQACIDSKCVATVSAGGSAGGGLAGGLAGGRSGGGVAAGGSAAGGAAAGGNVIAGGAAGGVVMAGGAGGGLAGGTAGGGAAGAETAGGTTAGGEAGGGSGGGAVAAGGSAGGVVTAGGSAGGVVTAGGTTAGGLAGGGSTAGGAAAGGAAGGTVLVASCPTNCAVYAPCRADFDGGRCVNVSVSLTAPVNLAIYDAGASVPVSATATMWDGGVFPGLIPLTSSFGTNQTIASGTTTNITLPSSPGTSTFTAGWASPGPSAQASVQGIGCTRTCQDWQFCLATTDGGVCQSLNLSLTWTTPDAGLAFNSSSVSARLTVSRTGGPVPSSLTTIPVFTPQGTVTALTASGGSFATSLPMVAPEGDKTFVAGWPDGGPTASLRIVRDTIAPVVTLSVIPRPATLPDPFPAAPESWKKNEKALVRVVVTDGPALPASALSVVDSGVVFSPTSTAACSCTTCQCFEAPMLNAAEYVSRSRLVAFLRADSISDSAGNPSVPVEDEIPITRFLWQRSIPGTPKLALSESGLLVISSQQRAWAIAPDGGTLWSWNSGSTSDLPPPALANGSLYTAVYDGSNFSSIKQLDLQTGAVVATLCEEDVGAKFDPRLAFATTGLGTEVVIGTRKGSLAVGISGCPTTAQLSVNAQQGLVTQREPGNGLGLYVAFAGQPVAKFVFDGFTFADGGISISQGADLAMAPQTLFFRDTANAVRMVATNDLGLPAGSQASETNVVLTSTTAYLADGSDLRQCTYASSLSCSPLLPLPFLPRSLTKVPGGFVMQRTSGGIEEVSLSGAVRPASSGGFDFMLDAPRTASGVKACGQGFGTLYFADGNGDLFAVLVNAQGLDSNSVWPRAAHDNANSNNFDRSIAPWSCP